MATATTPGMHSVMITEEERAELIRMLEQVLRENRVEVHRTHTPDYRERVMGEATLLRGLLEKFQQVRTYE